MNDRASLTVCVDVLAETFAAEPAAMRFCGRHDRKRTAWFDDLLRAHTTLPGRRILVTHEGRPTGVAITTAPGGQPTLATQLAWSWRTLRHCGPRTLAGTTAYIRKSERWKPHDAWTLEFVGVLTQSRGRGIARQLFEHAQTLHPGAPAFLTTADPANVALYEKWDFSVSDQALVAGLQVAGMTRPPWPSPGTPR